MKKTLKYILSIAALTAALTLPAKATFSITPQPIAEPPHSEKFFIDNANKNVSSFTGTVGGHVGQDVTVTTTGNVNTGAGFAEIKPDLHTRQLLTDLIFTPSNPNLFGDFNFRGQLVGAGSVDITVTDNQGNPSQTFTFGPFTKDEDFGRIGIFSADGETIKSVEINLVGGDTFKEVKQIAFSGGIAATPDGGATVMLLGAALSVLGMARRYLKS
jgi:hypothetical protein